MATEVVPGADTPVGYQQITSASTSQALTIPANARWAIIVPESQAVRFRDDGSDPTATVGTPLAVGQPLLYTGNLKAFRVIEQTASAKINVSFYG